MIENFRFFEKLQKRPGPFGGLRKAITPDISQKVTNWVSKHH